MGIITVNPDTTIELPKFFGLSLRRMTIDLGFNQSPTSYSLSLVQDSDDVFTLKSLENEGIFSIVNIVLGDINEQTIVVSWSQVEKDINGKNIFQVQLLDFRFFINIVSIFITNMDFDIDIGNSLLVNSKKIDDIKENLDIRIFEFNEQKIQIDISEVVDLIQSSEATTPQDSLGRQLVSSLTPEFDLTCPDSPVSKDVFESLPMSTNVLSLSRPSVNPALVTGGLSIVDGASVDPSTGGILITKTSLFPQTILLSDQSISLSNYIDEILTEQGADWHITTFIDNDVINIKIIPIHRSLQKADEVGTTIDQIISSHGEDLVSKKNIGIEGNLEAGQRLVLFGARKQKLTKLFAWRQFWGFDPDTNEPFEDPTLIFNGEKATLSREILRKLFNEELTQIPRTSAALFTPENESENPFNIDEQDKRIAAKAYAQEFWGKKFYIPLAAQFLDDDLLPVIKTVKSAWLESEVNPETFGNTAKTVFQTPDGRWKSFIRVSQPVDFREWDALIARSDQVFINADQLFMVCSPVIIGNFLIIELQQPVIFKKLKNKGDRINKEAEELLRDRSESIDHAHIAIETSKERYGPWSNDVDNTFQTDLTKIEINNNLSPWMFNRNDLTDSEALNLLDKFTLQNIFYNLPRKKTLTTMDITVIDLPRVTIGEIIQGGSVISQISIMIGIDGISTRYQAKTFSGSLIKKLEKDFTRQQSDFQRKDVIDECKKEKDKNDLRKEEEIDDTLDPQDVAEELRDEIDEIFEELKPPVNTWLWSTERPKAGMGIIASKDTGPFYNINRVDQVISLNPFDTAGFKSEIFTEWTKVRNIAENDDSPGYLQVGERVEITLYDTGQVIARGTDPGPIGDAEDDFGGGAMHVSVDDDTRKVPIISKTPTVFAVPIP